WLGSDSGSVHVGLEAAYRTALLLQERAGLGFVVAPVPAAGGQTAVLLSEGYSLAVFPYVAGASGRWGDPVSATERRQLLELLARLHLATASVAGVAQSRPVELAGRAGLEQALSEVGQPWAGGPLSERARDAVRARAGVAG